jgi:hypothetical protein
MPCPFVRSTEYPTSAHRLHLCENPTRDGEVYAPDLGKLRDYCLRDCGYETCPGYKAARRHCKGPTRGVA